MEPFCMRLVCARPGDHLLLERFLTLTAAGVPTHHSSLSAVHARQGCNLPVSLSTLPSPSAHTPSLLVQFLLHALVVISEGRGRAIPLRLIALGVAF